MSVVRDMLRNQRPASRGRSAVAALAAPVVATAVAIPLSRQGSSVAVTLYLLGVVLAATAGGVWSGIGAAVCSSLAFTYFFTAPRDTFRVARTEDLIAAIVFLAVAVIVGSLVARALDERARAERREREARLLGYLSTKLLSGESTRRVLQDFATALLEPFGLASCDIDGTLGGEPIVASAALHGAVASGPREIVPLVIGDVPFGTLTAVRPEAGRPLNPEERLLLEAAAKQAAVALERVRMDQRVRGAQLEAETNQLRAALFSSVTHDLRTPLASIKAGVTSLLDESVTHDPTQERELLTTILEETDRLNRLVGNLMDLSKIRAGAMTPMREPMALEEIVLAVLARMRAHLKGYDIKTVIRPDLPDVWVDPMQIDQVLTNLLENAARLSPPGTEIQVSVAPFRDVLQVRLVDHGPGVPAEARELVFEAFHRGSDSDGQAGSGSGLGLAIARAIVLAHGGRIWIEGTPGGGATVVFEVPVEGSDEASPGEGPDGAAVRKGRG